MRKVTFIGGLLGVFLLSAGPGLAQPAREPAASGQPAVDAGGEIPVAVLRRGGLAGAAAKKAAPGVAPVAADNLDCDSVGNACLWRPSMASA